MVLITRLEEMEVWVVVDMAVVVVVVDMAVVVVVDMVMLASLMKWVVVVVEEVLFQ